MLPVILCGGSGSRLWPLSRTQYPKQFLPLSDSSSLLQNTVERLAGFDSLMVVCNQDHRFLVAEQLRDVDAPVDILLEPCGRDTAPAIALAALNAVSQGNGEEVLVVLPSDHYMDDAELFNEKLKRAEGLASEGVFVSLGIAPSRAETGYGYIKVDKSDGSAVSTDAYEIQQFIEKPNAEMAKQYVESGEFLWNSGIYLFRADCYLETLQRLAPDVYSACLAAYEQAVSDMDFVRIDVAAFERCPDISIDYAIMEPLCMDPLSAEQGASAMVVPLDLQWSDLGSWSALWELKSKDAHANVVEGDVLLKNTCNSFISAQDKLIAVVGVKGLVVVDTPDALLVSSTAHVQDVKFIVDALKAEKRDEYIKHREVYRPWGKYDLIGQGDGFQVKQITVHPGAKLSLQKHQHRAEHWVVVNGEAEIQRGEERFRVSKNQSTFIPLGEIHSLVNPGGEDLVMIEVQSGDYLGEDDIVRYEDLYGRA